MHRSVAVVLVLVGCAPEPEGTPIRTTLADGQVMSGGVNTRTLRLEGGLGTLDIPLEDVGEVVPVEGDDLAQSNGNVTVWLRNGSELVGRWANPELSMGISVGGEIVDVDLPMDDLMRIQTQGAELWPDGTVYRVRTTHGDDFLVDADVTRVVLENDLGTFAPYLSECAHIAPVAGVDGDWRIELLTGTVLLGPLQDGEIEFALPHGPDRVVVPLDRFVSMERQYWSAPAISVTPADQGWDQPAEAVEVDKLEQGPTPRAATTVGGQGGRWFDNSSLSSEKARH